MPTPPARILVVDDSVVVRKALSDLIAGEPSLELAGTASNGSLGLTKLEQISCDLVVLDVEMPEMDGITAAARIREKWPRLPILMCSTLTARGADATLRALAAGATDYVAKPSAMNGNDAMAAFATDFINKLKGLTEHRRHAADPAPRKIVPLAAPTRTRTPPRKPAILAIGCSTGGPNALATVFANLPKDLGVPVVITQHMPPLFTRMLAERLTASSGIPVVEAAEGDVLEPNRAYVAPGDYHMTFRRDGVHIRVVLNQDPPENSCRPAVDVMFRSVAKLFGPDTIAAVLTGMGHDGAVGARYIAEAGGWIIVQDEKSCVVPSMPNSVVALGVHNETIELSRLGQHFGLRCRTSASPFQRRQSV